MMGMCACYHCFVEKCNRKKKMQHQKDRFYRLWTAKQDNDEGIFWDWCGNGGRSNVVVSFPLRFTCIVQEMKRLVDAGELGDVVTVQAINNVPYGNVYYHSWYRDSTITGGLFLQKSTHDIDYITYILGKRPVSVSAKTAKMHFKGEKPAGLRCVECPEYHTCPESSFVAEHYLKEEPSREYCCFAEDTGNEDVGAALFSCEDGTIISYHQVFLVKNEAGRRCSKFEETS